MFRLSPESGQVFVTSSLLADSKDNQDKSNDKFYLRIRATDRSGHITESQLVVHVLNDQLDQPPMMKGLAAIDGGHVQVLDKDTLSIKEDTPIGTYLARIMATDESSSLNEFKLVYTLKDETVENLRGKKSKIVEAAAAEGKRHFKIDPVSGNLLLTSRLSSSLKYVVGFSIADEKGNLIEEEITVTVKDVNDHSPMFEREDYEFDIEEGEVKLQGWENLLFFEELLYRNLFSKFLL